MAIVILAFHAAPVHKKIFTTVKYDSKPPFGMGLDHQWLGFFQYETGAVFTTLGAGQPDPFMTYGRAERRADAGEGLRSPRAKWLIEHQDARPYGDGDGARAAEAGPREAARGGRRRAGRGPGGTRLGGEAPAPLVRRESPRERHRDRATAPSRLEELVSLALA